MGDVPAVSRAPCWPFGQDVTRLYPSTNRTSACKIDDRLVNGVRPYVPSRTGYCRICERIAMQAAGCHQPSLRCSAWDHEQNLLEKQCTDAVPCANNIQHLPNTPLLQK